jgi:hypothetical protein
LNEIKFIVGSYALVENVGVTLIEPLLATLPKPLQRLRIGPLASPARYTVRDWFITNQLCLYIAFLYFALNFKTIMRCGPRDGWVWNIEREINGVMRRYPQWQDGEDTCYDMPQTSFNQEVKKGAEGIIVFSMIMFNGWPVLFTVLAIWMARKLPGWGEPPAADGDGARMAPAAAPDKDGGKRSTAKKVANAAICAATTAVATAGGVSAVASSLEVQA